MPPTSAENNALPPDDPRPESNLIVITGLSTELQLLTGPPSPASLVTAPEAFLPNPNQLLTLPSCAAMINTLEMAKSLNETGTAMKQRIQAGLIRHNIYGVASLSPKMRSIDGLQRYTIVAVLRCVAIQGLYNLALADMHSSICPLAGDGIDTTLNYVLSI
jgi:hypothetical protein